MKQNTISAVAGLLLIGSIFFGQAVLAQEKVTAFGIQFKPMIPSKYFGTGSERFDGDEFSVNFSPLPGYNFGMIIRQGLTKRLSMETGINMVQRRFRLGIDHTILKEEKNLDFRLIGYEIPVQALVYVRLDNKLWMNASGGFSIDVYPSNVKSSTSTFVDSLSVNIEQFTLRRNWIQFALLANYGFEWRTEKSGYIYLGASFHRPFTDIAYTNAVVTVDNNPSGLIYALNGSYLTVDLRYFFHEDGKRAKKSMRSEPLNK
ncbi:MAG: outer membrane beta-barrel protein [Crocinitomicaceae bacterium]|nr:outer membrane beta-barrel protein [Crocinitomicaceae bacterium]